MVNINMASVNNVFKLFIPRRVLSRQCFCSTSLKQLHPLKKILSKYDVLEYLSKNILYKDGKIIAFNKPANVAKSAPESAAENSRFGSPVYINDLLKELASLVPDFKSLKIVKFPERYTSGVMILAGSEEAETKISKVKRRAKGGIELCDKFLAISQGKPVRMKDSLKLAVRYKECDRSKRKVPVLEENWSQNDMKMQRINIFRVAHSVISNGAFASLTEVSTSSSKKNALRLYFSTKLLSPILGDSIFSSRVQDLMGVPMLLDPWSDVANSPKRLPADLLAALQLSSNDTNIVPLFLHLAEVRLPGYLKNKDLVLEAPPPPHFQWACHQLQLNLQLNDQESKAIDAG